MNMSGIISMVALEKDNLTIYIEVGKKSYVQHYLDFWADGNTSPYINESFTKEVLEKELMKNDSALFVIYSNNTPVGILKIIIDKTLGAYSKKDALLLQKLYLLAENSGKGIGSKVLGFVEDFARKRHKKIIWLDTMVKGKAIPFYKKNGYEIHSKKQLHYKNIKDEKREMYVMVKVL